MAGIEDPITVGAVVTIAGGIIGTLFKLHLDEDGRTRQRLTDAERRLDTSLEGSKQHADVADRSVALAERAVDRLTGPAPRRSTRRAEAD